MSIVTLARTGLARSGLYIRKFAPEILTGVGVCLEVFAVGYAMKSADKAHVVIENHRDKIANINDNTAGQMVIKDSEGGEIKPVSLKKEKAKVYFSTAGQLAKVYWPAIASTAASVSCFGASLGIMRSRTAALTTAYTVLQNNFKGYRDRVIDKLGEEEESHIFYNTEDAMNEEGNTQHIIKKENDTDGKPSPRVYSQFARMFDCGNKNWSDIPGYNLMFLRRAQQWANDKLNAQGHLFLNEVFDMLGIDRDEDGALNGWLKTNDNSTHNFVDFGIDRCKTISERAFLSGEEPTVVLDFNVDGLIYDLLSPAKRVRV